MFKDCPSCNAQMTGPICEYCGRRADESDQFQREKKQLKDFLNNLRTERQKEDRVSIINHGFVPSTEKGLIMAGLDILPYLSPTEEDTDVQAAAAARLQTIKTRLRLLPPTENIEKSLVEFQAAFEAYKKEDRQNLMLGLGCLAICLAALGGGIYWVTQLF